MTLMSSYDILEPVLVSKRVAITSQCLMSRNSYEAAAIFFGLSKSVNGKILVMMFVILPFELSVQSFLLFVFTSYLYITQKVNEEKKVGKH